MYQCYFCSSQLTDRYGFDYSDYDFPGMAYCLKCCPRTDIEHFFNEDNVLETISFVFQYYLFEFDLCGGIMDISNIVDMAPRYSQARAVVSLKIPKNFSPKRAPDIIKMLNFS